MDNLLNKLYKKVLDTAGAVCSVVTEWPSNLLNNLSLYKSTLVIAISLYSIGSVIAPPINSGSTDGDNDSGDYNSTATNTSLLLELAYNLSQPNCLALYKKCLPEKILDWLEAQLMPGAQEACLAIFYRICDISILLGTSAINDSFAQSNISSQLSVVEMPHLLPDNESVILNESLSDRLFDALKSIHNITSQLSGVGVPQLFPEVEGR